MNKSCSQNIATHDNSTLTNSTNSDHSSTEPLSIMAAAFICVLIISTLVANTCVCYAIARYRSIRRLQDVTGCFVMNLCVADILVAIVSMPVWAIFQIYGVNIRFIVGITFLNLWRYVDILCGTAIILSLCAISIDRYWAITRPLVYGEYCTGWKVFCVIGFIWVYAATTAALRQLPWATPSGYAWLVLVASLLLPFTIISVTYGKIFLVANRHAQQLRRLPNVYKNYHYKRRSYDIKAARTIAVVIGTFVCCWIPFCVMSVLYGYRLPVNIAIGNTTKWLAYLNPLLNPVVYSFLDKQIRNVVLKRVNCWKTGTVTTQDYRSNLSMTQLRDTS